MEQQFLNAGHALAIFATYAQLLKIMCRARLSCFACLAPTHANRHDRVLARHIGRHMECRHAVFTAGALINGQLAQDVKLIAAARGVVRKRKC
jgi:hypothetical protein